MTFESGDVVTVPFPFTDRRQAKRRPAVVLSSRRLSAHANQYVLAMVTSARHERWPFDVPVTDGPAAGLRAPSVVRWKLFTLDASLIVRRVGTLAESDRRVLRHRMNEALVPQGARK
ncbi:MAG: type II toxin-antitoxin system PemK/MazF family toxin [Gemmatimonadetes bacterium]|nr:type II toxin-antitoxin system PemK/MazF family toxin [Gemmatimonadota bacterium]